MLSSSAKNKDGYPLSSHKSCLPTYMPVTHIKRYLKKRKVSCQLEAQSQLKVLLRSSTKDSFDFNKHCLFCGKECQMTPNPKHPDLGIKLRYAIPPTEEKETKHLKKWF